MITNFNSNSTIKVSGGSTYYGNGSPITIFTTAANEYAILTASCGVALSLSANPSLKINSSPISSAANTAITIYVPPSSSVVFDGNSGAAFLGASWVKFINSP